MMKRFNLFLAVALTIVTGCKPAEKNFAARGIIRQISSDRHTITIQHEAIPGYMMAMTMDFAVRETNELKGISPDDEIAFKLAVTDDTSWIQQIRLVAHHTENQTNAGPVFPAGWDELKVGDALPDGDLVAEDGRQIHFSDFRGQALAFTFFFTRCPLPDFCPRMNRNFFETRKLLLASTPASANWQLLSVSFDPDFDRPEVLSASGNFYRGSDTNRWLFAAASKNTLAQLAPRLNLMIMRDGANIMSHNLRTVVLGPDGKILRLFDGNGWTPQELADAIQAAAKPAQLP